MLGIEDFVGKIIALESGQMSLEQAVAFGSELVKTGAYRQLQGSYHRFVYSLIDSGHIDEQGNILRETDEVGMAREVLREIDNAHGLSYTEVIRKLQDTPGIDSIEVGYDNDNDTSWATIGFDGEEYTHKAYWALDCILGAVGRIVRPEHYESSYDEYN